MDLSIFDGLIGLSIKDNKTDYGKVMKFVTVSKDDKTVVYAILTSITESGKNKAITLRFLSELLASQKMFLRRKDDGKFFIVAYPEGHKYAKRVFSGKRSHRYSICGIGSINNTAIIKDERIDITKTVSSNESTKISIKNIQERTN
jgi:predicted membrane protein